VRGRILCYLRGRGTDLRVVPLAPEPIRESICRREIYRHHSWKSDHAQSLAIWSRKGSAQSEVNWMSPGRSL